MTIKKPQTNPEIPAVKISREDRLIGVVKSALAGIPLGRTYCYGEAQQVAQRLLQVVDPRRYAVSIVQFEGHAAAVLTNTLNNDKLMINVGYPPMEFGGDYDFAAHDERGFFFMNPDVPQRESRTLQTICDIYYAGVLGLSTVEQQPELYPEPAPCVMFEEGVQRIVNVAKAAKDKPALIGVYGTANAGKSELIERVTTKLKSQGVQTVYTHGGPKKFIFERIRDDQVGAALFHCAWDYMPIAGHREKEEPEVLAQDVFGRPLDMRVAIYSPSLRVRENPPRGPSISIDKKPIGEYHLFVMNPDAGIKVRWRG